MGNSKSSKTIDVANTPGKGKNKKPEKSSGSKPGHGGKSTQAGPPKAGPSNAAAKVAAGKMPIDLYYTPPSAPCRAVMMVAKAVGVEVNLKAVDMMKGEHLKPEFLKLNPQHTLPTMNDNGLIMWESRAILGYLVGQYAKDDSLYPQEAQARAIVDQRLFFDFGTFYASFRDYYIAFILTGVKQDEDKLHKFEEAMGFFNTFLQERKFVAADHLTIADISMITTIANLDAIGFDFSPYPNVFSWYGRTKEALAPYGCEEINQAGANIIGGIYKAKLGQS